MFSAFWIRDRCVWTIRNATNIVTRRILNRRIVLCVADGGGKSDEWEDEGKEGRSRAHGCLEGVGVGGYR